MIVEKAEITVVEGREDEFVVALDKARQVIAQAHGFLGLRVGRGVERPSTFVLLIEWATLEDHTVGFRESELFTQWRAIIGSFFESAPHVEHIVVEDSLALPA